MKRKKLKSLEDFKVESMEMKKIKGGFEDIVHWTKDYTFTTMDVATYIDGFNMGTDGHRD